MVLSTDNKTNNNKKSLNPYYVTGYTDGDGSFSVRFRKTGVNKFLISPVFSIGAEVNPPNLELLQKLKDFFEHKGSISRSGNMYYYEITGLSSLKLVINHFKKFLLESTKIIYFELWCVIINLLEKKIHHTPEGLRKIISIKSLFPRGVKKVILENYAELIVIKKPLFIPKVSALNPYWIAGFVQADGSFGLHCVKSVRSKLGFICNPQFRITQHKKDLVLLKRIITSLSCGRLVKPALNRDRYDMSVNSLSNLKQIVVPFFNNHRLYGAKYIDFKCFSQGISIMEKKGHLTSDGLNSLKILAYRMNTYRKF